VRRLVLALLLLSAMPALAHEVRPAYLELREDAPNQFRVLWKTPMRGELRLALSPAFSGRTEALTPIATRRTGSAAVQSWRLRAIDPLRGQSVRIDGLEASMTDALVRMEFADGTGWVKRLTPAQPAAEIPARQSIGSVAGEYLALGVEHILLGIDHLLFVLALLLSTQGGWRLVKAITAFTIAHTLTLALAALGFVHVPQAPVEAVIALSIVFVAGEILRSRNASRVARRGDGLIARAPWVVAFVFGLLHGFGFAGALAETGLPEHAIPVALFFFNVGVEAGQLLFVLAVLASMTLLQRVRFPRWVQLVPPYAIGSVAMFWVIQRVGAF
jgi:hydrogenase/urease accessory protein HupE